MADVNIGIGARDAASRILAKTETNVKKVGTTLDKTSARSRVASQRFVGSLKSIAKAAGAAAIALGALKAIRGIFNGLSNSIAAFNIQEKAVRSLEKAIELAGGSAAQASPRLQDFASKLQLSLNVGDEVTLGLAAQASMLGVATDSIDDAAKAAIGLSEATGINLQTAMKRVTGATNGVFGELGELIPAVRNATTTEEKLAAVLQVAEKGLQQKAHAAGTLEGVMTRASNSVGDLMESVGALLAPMKMAISTGIAAFAESLSAALVPAVERSKQLIEDMRPVFDAVATVGRATGAVLGVAFSRMQDSFMALAKAAGITAETVAGGSDFIQKAINTAARFIVKGISIATATIANLPTVLEIAVTQGQLILARMEGFWSHLFENSLPAMVKWFASATANVIADMATHVLTTISSMASRSVGIITALFTAMTTRSKASVGALATSIANFGVTATTELNKEFKTNLPDLPEIVGRSITQKEKTLEEKMAKLGGNLANAFGDEFAKNLTALDTLLGKGGGGFFDGIDLSLAGGDGGGLSSKTPSGLQATQGRLLSRGGNQTSKELEQLKIANKKAEEQLVALKGMEALQRDQEAGDKLQIEVING